jgi:hypothetical protein
MIKKMAEKQKTAKIAKPHSQKKSGLRSLLRRHHWEKRCPHQVAQLKKGSFHRLQESNTDEFIKDIPAGYSQLPTER